MLVLVESTVLGILVMLLETTDDEGPPGLAVRAFFVMADPDVAMA